MAADKGEGRRSLTPGYEKTAEWAAGKFKEWEKPKNQSVFKPFHRPQCNRNRDEWITADEAPKAPSAQ
jgi:hypothetical protein